MAKDLPYFKFYCSEWISGAITLESMTVQGLFINICALYWFKSGSLKTSELQRRIKLKTTEFNRLVESNFIKVEGDFVKISFLDEQFSQRNHVKKVNSVNGSLGGAPKGNRNAYKNNRKQPKTTNIEEEEKKNRERVDTYANAQEFLEDIQKDELYLEGAARVLRSFGIHADVDKELKNLFIRFVGVKAEKINTKPSRSDLRKHFLEWIPYQFRKS